MQSRGKQNNKKKSKLHAKSHPNSMYPQDSSLSQDYALVLHFLEKGAP